MLFGLSWLKASGDFARASAHVKSLARSLRGDVAVRLCGPQPGSVVAALDDFSNELCRVIDAAEVTRIVHRDAAWRRSAHRAHEELTALAHELNCCGELRSGLERSLRSVAEGTEEHRVGKKILAEFAPSSKEEALGTAGVAVQDSLDHLSASFHRNLHAHDFRPTFAELSKTPALRSEIPEGLASFGAAVVTQFLRKASSEELRKRLYFDYHQSPSSNVQVVGELVRQRSALAKVYGKGSYAGYLLSSNSIAGSPQAVVHFLSGLSTRLAPHARDEYNLLIQTANQCLSPARVTKVQPWNRLYLMDKTMRQGVASSGADPAAMSMYLPLSACLEGLKTVIEELFDVECSIDKVSNEGWSSNLVYKFTCKHGGGETIGAIYLDLFPHEHKAPHQNAHYTIQCGRQESQMPIMALLCNFVGERYGQGEVLLFPVELETLFHEFGHALHSLFSRSRYTYLAGTRCEVDFIEVPSILFEKFALHPAVASRFTRHVRTGDRMPTSAIQSYKQTRGRFWALEMQNQVAFALFDQAVHNKSGRDGLESVTETLLGTMEEHTLIPHARGTTPEARFQHLVGYGAHYYSYVFSQCVSHNLWRRAGFDADPLNRQGGELLRALLSQSGCTDPGETLLALGSGSFNPVVEGCPVGSRKCLIPSIPEDVSLLRT